MERRFASDPNLLGKELILNGHHFTIVGVTPKEFNGLNPEKATKVWLNIDACPGDARFRTEHKGSRCDMA